MKNLTVPTYFVLAEQSNHIDRVKESFCIQAADADTAFDLAKGELFVKAEPYARWVIIDFKRVE